ncbi:MAG: sugar phosphate isomerase/epimerase family protein [Armatimonadota bacterium]
MFKNLAPGAIGIKCGWVEGLDLARQAGFEGADLNISDAQALAAARGTDSVRALYAERGLKLGGWSFPVQWRGTEDEFFESLGELPAQARLAAELGCFRTFTWVLGWSDELPRQEHFDRVVRRFRLSAEILRDYGHSLGLEFIGPRTSRAPHRYGFVHTMDGMLTLACAVGTGNVGLLFDVWHWYTAQSTLDDLRKLTAEDVVYVHLNDAPAGIDVLDQIDNRRCLPAETGVIPNGDLLRTLHEIGYEGPVTVEPFNQPLRELAERDPLQAARVTMESLDRVFAEAGLA